MGRGGGYVSSTGELRNLYRLLITKPKKKRLLGGARYRGEDDIMMDLMEMICEDIGRIHLD